MNPLGFLRTLREERRALGWKGLLKKRGWRLLVIVFVAYLIRDLILYVALPLAAMAWFLR